MKAEHPDNSPGAPTVGTDNQPAPIKARARRCLRCRLYETEHPNDLCKYFTPRTQHGTKRNRQPPPVLGSDTARCGMCGQEKPNGMFYRRKNGELLTQACKLCSPEYQRKSRLMTLVRKLGTEAIDARIREHEAAIKELIGIKEDYYARKQKK